MPRVKVATAAKKRRKKILKASKGYYGRRGNAYRVAKTQQLKSMAYAYIGRKLKKRDFRSLWIVRLNAALRDFGLSYSKFIHLLNKNNIKLNRLILSNMAIEDPEGFKNLVNAIK
ncbi:MAG: 50S ribosomal protein L20 [Spirochaetes bacterium]|nr:50S ribosomal protein L20 [Spirochaetota bacterium]